ncbi:hypothetical protein IC620_13525 [Hazenella sp. IB182357]|uniref:Uncharacterized protein n=1 Tax=Polycladospora coralii TaxID=2771432 RepID=A0A926N6P1_9BACL|nr:hypothetical protein [Polycladospora coralii]MBD1373369.1 hypothetical protein [Polycladospora coralii]
MFTLFVEYQIDSKYWSQYIEMIPEIKNVVHQNYQISAYEILVSLQQEGKVVESIKMLDKGECEALRVARLYDPLLKNSKFNVKKINAWVFENIRT